MARPTTQQTRQQRTNSSQVTRVQVKDTRTNYQKGKDEFGINIPEYSNQLTRQSLLERGYESSGNRLYKRGKKYQEEYSFDSKGNLIAYNYRGRKKSRSGIYRSGKLATFEYVDNKGRSKGKRRLDLERGIGKIVKRRDNQKKIKDIDYNKNISILKKKRSTGFKSIQDIKRYEKAIRDAERNKNRVEYIATSRYAYPEAKVVSAPIRKQEVKSSRYSYPNPQIVNAPIRGKKKDYTKVFGQREVIKNEPWNTKDIEEQQRIITENTLKVVKPSYDWYIKNIDKPIYEKSGKIKDKAIKEVKDKWKEYNDKIYDVAKDGVKKKLKDAKRDYGIIKKGSKKIIDFNKRAYEKAKPIRDLRNKVVDRYKSKIIRGIKKDKDFIVNKTKKSKEYFDKYGRELIKKEINLKNKYRKVKLETLGVLADYGKESGKKLININKELHNKVKPLRDEFWNYKTEEYKNRIKNNVNRIVVLTPIASKVLKNRIESHNKKAEVINKIRNPILKRYQKKIQNGIERDLKKLNVYYDYGKKKFDERGKKYLEAYAKYKINKGKNNAEFLVKSIDYKLNEYKRKENTDKKALEVFEKHFSKKKNNDIKIKEDKIELFGGKTINGIEDFEVTKDTLKKLENEKAIKNKIKEELKSKEGSYKLSARFSNLQHNVDEIRRRYPEEFKYLASLKATQLVKLGNIIQNELKISHKVGESIILDMPEGTLDEKTAKYLANKMNQFTKVAQETADKSPYYGALWATHYASVIAPLIKLETVKTVVNGDLHADRVRKYGEALRDEKGWKDNPFLKYGTTIGNINTRLDRMHEEYVPGKYGNFIKDSGAFVPHYGSLYVKWGINNPLDFYYTQRVFQEAIKGTTKIATKKIPSKYKGKVSSVLADTLDVGEDLLEILPHTPRELIPQTIIGAWALNLVGDKSTEVGIKAGYNTLALPHIISEPYIPGEMVHKTSDSIDWVRRDEVLDAKRPYHIDFTRVNEFMATDFKGKDVNDIKLQEKTGFEKKSNEYLKEGNVILHGARNRHAQSIKEYSYDSKGDYDLIYDGLNLKSEAKRINKEVFDNKGDIEKSKTKNGKTKYVISNDGNSFDLVRGSANAIRLKDGTRLKSINSEIKNLAVSGHERLNYKDASALHQALNNYEHNFKGELLFKSHLAVHHGKLRHGDKPGKFTTPTIYNEQTGEVELPGYYAGHNQEELYFQRKNLSGAKILVYEADLNPNPIHISSKETKIDITKETSFKDKQSMIESLKKKGIVSKDTRKSKWITKKDMPKRFHDIKENNWEQTKDYYDWLSNYIDKGNYDMVVAPSGSTISGSTFKGDKSQLVEREILIIGKPGAVHSGWTRYGWFDFRPVFSTRKMGGKGTLANIKEYSSKRSLEKKLLKENLNRLEVEEKNLKIDLKNVKKEIRKSNDAKQESELLFEQKNIQKELRNIEQRRETNYKQYQRFYQPSVRTNRREEGRREDDRRLPERSRRPQEGRRRTPSRRPDRRTNRTNRAERRETKEEKRKIDFLEDETKYVRGYSPVFVKGKKAVGKGHNFKTKSDAHLSGMNIVDNVPLNRYYVNEVIDDKDTFKNYKGKNVAYKFNKKGATRVEKRNFRFDKQNERKGGNFDIMPYIFGQKT